ncbi:hypothetical protein COLO4_13371 [Corchorus olitorius]|uniref:Uncharacterized protein n=1 Tax=Corchorus olitorius TaxID=93759 RepID=A0A1R3JWR3_9ROSI|nr:hypothetical protein COLO4_13371 [Corchorus olitorius]
MARKVKAEYMSNLYPINIKTSIAFEAHFPHQKLAWKMTEVTWEINLEVSHLGPPMNQRCCDKGVPEFTLAM